MELTDNELHALVDGELSTERQAELMAIIAADPALARRVCELRHLKAQVHLDPPPWRPLEEEIGRLKAEREEREKPKPKRAKRSKSKRGYGRRAKRR